MLKQLPEDSHDSINLLHKGKCFELKYPGNDKKRCCHQSLSGVWTTSKKITSDSSRRSVQDGLYTHGFMNYVCLAGGNDYILMTLVHGCEVNKMITKKKKQKQS